MIDLHCHILPNVDDGAATSLISLEMARQAASDGVTHVACTPHIVEGKYPNTSATIFSAIDNLQALINKNNISLKLLSGADIHVAWDLPEKLLAKQIPTLNGSRYFLLEPPHLILPPKLDQLVARLLEVGFVPIITHPERLAWIKKKYDVIVRLHEMGCLMQLTAQSITDGFGADAKFYSEKMIEDGMVSLFASDGHSSTWRKPLLSKARNFICEKYGNDMAEELFVNNPAKIIADEIVDNKNVVINNPVKGKNLLKKNRSLLHRFWLRY